MMSTVTDDEEDVSVVRSTSFRLFCFFFANKASPRILPLCSWVECVINNSPLSYREVQLELL